MQNTHYILCKMSLSRHKLYQGKEKLVMDINTYIKREIEEKDRINLEKTKRAAMEHLENGTPLVDKFEEKIANFCKRYGMTRGQVLASILSDTVAASKFAKSANRQGTAEKAQIKYLQRFRNLPIKVLPSSGKNSIRLSLTGDFIVGGPRRVDATKTLDAICGDDFIFCKYTTGSGGAQDNQAIDVIRFLEAAHAYVKKNKNKYRFVAILDGNYYARHRDMFERFKSDRVLIETSDTYKKSRRQVIKKIFVR